METETFITEAAVETLTDGSCFHSLSGSPKLSQNVLPQPYGNMESISIS